MFGMYILAIVCLRLSRFSIIFHVMYGVGRFQLTHLSLDDCEYVYFTLLPSSNRKYEVSAIV